MINNFLVGPPLIKPLRITNLLKVRSYGFCYPQMLQYQAAAPLIARGLLLPHEMPLKGGARLRSLVANPLYIENSTEDRRRMIESYDKAMIGDRVDVLLKRQHTLEFLQMADSSSAELEKEQCSIIDSNLRVALRSDCNYSALLHLINALSAVGRPS